MQNPHVVIFGGTGRLGRLLTGRLLEQGRIVRVASRTTPHLAHPYPEYVRADVRDPHAVARAVRGAGAVVYSVEPGLADHGPDSPRSTMHTGVLHVVEAARAEARPPQVVLVSQIYVTRQGHAQNRHGRLLERRLAGEDALRASGLPYTVLRPSWLTDRRGTDEGIRLEQGDRSEGSVSRESVAAVCAEALLRPAARGKTFEIYGEPGRGDRTPDWDGLFTALTADGVPALPAV